MDDGKRITVSAKVSEAVAVALDEARGVTSRSGYLEALLADHLGSMPAAALKCREPVKRGGQVAPARVPDLPAADRLPGAPPRPQVPEAAGKPPQFPCCRHCHHGGPKGHEYACTKC